MAGKRSCLVRLTGTRMSQKRDVNSYPDGYRVLNSSELQELLQDEEKMNQIVLLSEKVFLPTTHTVWTINRLFLCMLVIFLWSTVVLVIWTNCAVDYSIHILDWSCDLCSVLYALHDITYIVYRIQRCRPLCCRHTTKTQGLDKIMFCTDNIS